MNNSRPVSRVLVMLEYKPGEPSDVFDLTALATEIAGSPNSEHRHCRIQFSTTAGVNYSMEADPVTGKRPVTTEASWNVMADFNSSGDTGWLDDAINASMPDSIATQELRKKLKRVTQKAEHLATLIKTQRLADAAAVRHQRPIARVNIQPPALQENPNHDPQHR